MIIGGCPKSGRAATSKAVAGSSMHQGIRDEIIARNGMFSRPRLTTPGTKIVSMGFNGYVDSIYNYRYNSKLDSFHHLGTAWNGP